MAYAILRTAKLTSLGNVGGSARHTFRERQTPNADPERTGQNRTTGAQSSREVLAGVNARLATVPTVRKNAWRLSISSVLLLNGSRKNPPRNAKHISIKLKSGCDYVTVTKTLLPSIGNMTKPARIAPPTWSRLTPKAGSIARTSSMGEKSSV